MTHSPSPHEFPTRDLGHSHAVERTAWAFYAIAALGSIIGQIWVGVQAPPWPPGIAWWWRAVMVAPFAVVVDLGGVVTSAFADARRRLGETAYGWRILSASSVTTGVSINVLGHADVPYLAALFGVLGVFAYCVWLLHTAGRRRDALRAADKLADTAPVYGLAQWWHEPAVTRRARSLALEHRYGLQESLTLARDQLRAERRRSAVARHVETLIRSRHDDPVRADIAATTLDVDALAAELTAHADIIGWARVIGADLAPPPVAGTPSTGDDARDRTPADTALEGAVDVTPPLLPTDLMRRIPSSQEAYDQWRRLWAELADNPRADTTDFARRHGISPRQVQWIRRVGSTGLLNSPLPPAVRLAQLAAGNGHASNSPATTAP